MYTLNITETESDRTRQLWVKIVEVIPSKGDYLYLDNGAKFKVVRREFDIDTKFKCNRIHIIVKKVNK